VGIGKETLVGKSHARSVGMSTVRFQAYPGELSGPVGGGDAGVAELTLEAVAVELMPSRRSTTRSESSVELPQRSGTVLVGVETLDVESVRMSPQSESGLLGRDTDAALVTNRGVEVLLMLKLAGRKIGLVGRFLG
jgi:hypothetical protein